MEYKSKNTLKQVRVSQIHHINTIKEFKNINQIKNIRKKGEIE